MQPQSCGAPVDCQSPTVPAGGDPLGLADSARQWARRLPWAAVRRARRLTRIVRWSDRVDGSKGAARARREANGRETPTRPFEAGATVEVRSYEEIVATLDVERKCDGLEFMEGMRAFCGRRFTVLKRVERLFDESAGRMLRVKKERYVLDGVLCDGRGTSRREGCDRCCFYFWSRSWLRESA
jgi:hypothetical protein